MMWLLRCFPEFRALQSERDQLQVMVTDLSHEVDAERERAKAAIDTLANKQEEWEMRIAQMDMRWAHLPEPVSVNGNVMLPSHRLGQLRQKFLKVAKHG